MLIQRPHYTDVTEEEREREIERERSTQQQERLHKRVCVREREGGSL